MNETAPHTGWEWVEHVAPLVAVVTLFAVLWQPRPVVPSQTADAERRIVALAVLLGDSRSGPAQIEQALGSIGRFSPSSEASRSLAEAVSACGVSSLGETQRVELARQLYAITTGGDLLREQFELVLTDIQEVAIDARCSPSTIAALTESARRVGRTEPSPRRDWW